jgi:hypothetical protein
MLSALSDWWVGFKNSRVAFSRWLEVHSRWSALRSLGGSNLIKASVLMPAFGYMLLLNDNVHQYITIRYDGWLLNYVPNVWRVWLLFYGSFLLALATLLYSAFCPPDVKRYGSPYEKANAETEHVQRLGGAKGVANEYGEEYDAMSKREDELFPYLKMNLADPPGDLPAQLKRISKYLVQMWLIRNLKKPRLRGSICILFALGLTLIAIPAIFTFLQVSLIAVKRLFG